VIVTCLKLGSVIAMSLKFWNATRSRASRQISNHKLFDRQVALGELYSTFSMFFVRRRLYDATTSLMCFLRVLVLLMLRSKRSVRSSDRATSETALVSGVFAVLFLLRTAS
jgi:hypothetical protein